jgi:hypothetical protein
VLQHLSGLRHAWKPFTWQGGDRHIKTDRPNSPVSPTWTCTTRRMTTAKPRDKTAEDVNHHESMICTTASVTH